jgi:hypothetical protein
MCAQPGSHRCRATLTPLLFSVHCRHPMWLVTPIFLSPYSPYPHWYKVGLIFCSFSVVIKYTLTYFISFEGTWWDMQTFDNKSWGKGSLYPLQIRLQDSLLFGRCTRLIIRDDDSTQSPNLNVDVISCTTEKKRNVKWLASFLHRILYSWDNSNIKKNGTNLFNSFYNPLWKYIIYLCMIFFIYGWLKI